MIDLTHDEFVKRIKAIIPSIGIKKDTLNITAVEIKEATILVESLSEVLYELIEDLPETDLVVELKEGVIDLMCLGSLLGVSFSVIIRSLNDD